MTITTEQTEFKEALLILSLYIYLDLGFGSLCGLKLVLLSEINIHTDYD